MVCCCWRTEIGMLGRHGGKGGRGGGGEGGGLSLILACCRLCALLHAASRAEGAAWRLGFVTVTASGLAKPSNPQGGQRLMGFSVHRVPQQRVYVLAPNRQLAGTLRSRACINHSLTFAICAGAGAAQHVRVG
jgi:hypothetical protein